MNYFNSKYHFITVTALLYLLVSSCDLFVAENNGGQDEEEFIGACPVSLFDIVNERGFVWIMVELEMEDYVPHSQLDEEEKKKQNKAISNLQEEFLNILEEEDLKFLQ